MWPEVAPGDVALAYPDAVAVTESQLQEARDWAETLLTRTGVVLVPGSIEERQAVRAVMLYALALASGGHEFVLRMAENAMTAQTKRLGDVTIERKFADSQTVAAGHAQNAYDYLLLAWAALYAAGLPRRRAVVGASR